MTEEAVDAIEALTPEQKEAMKANIRNKAQLRFEDFRGKWYIPCCEQDLMQINTYEDWRFAYNFDPNFAAFETYDTKEEALKATGEHTGGGGYDPITLTKVQI